MSISYEKWNSLNCILPAKYVTDHYDNKFSNNRIAVFIHLHYHDTFDYYKAYIDNIPKEIAVYFTTSNNELNKEIKNFTDSRANCKLIQKSNRGRDISSFLVACRKDILNFEYICFLHDKREKNTKMKSDIEQWIYSQWENMLGSETYIYNVISYFNRNPRVGLLLPPLPLSDRIPFLYSRNWGGNYKNTIALAKRLNLRCDINNHVSPMALGTVYWARVDALKKLLEHEWQYEDFDVEPLAEDGTVSHAIERILEFVAKDAEYECKWVMTDRYAEERLGYFQAALFKGFERLQKSLGIRYLYELNQFDDRSFELKKLCQDFKKIYIFGAGLIGVNCLHFMRHIEVKVDAFLVTNMVGNKPVIENIPVSPFGLYELDNDSFVIIAVKKSYQKEILKKLKERQFPMKNIYNWDLYEADLY